MRSLLAMTLLALPAFPQNVAAPERFAAVRAAIAAEVEAGNSPSIAVGVLDRGEIVWAEGFGSIDVERRRPATADSIYRLASISKPFTATAIMQLVERGLIDLDAPVNRYLDVPLRAYRGRAEDITVRRLLNHTAGLPTHWNFFYANPEGGDRPPDREESIRRFGFAAFEPGTQTNYSNFAFGVLDHLVARQGKHPNGYRGWLVQHLLDPLGMTHTDVGVRPGKEEHAAIGYRRQGSGWEAVRDYGFDHDGASAVRSSVNDLMRFARLQLLRGKVSDLRLLDEASVQAMRERTAAKIGNSYGIGWSVGEVRGAAVLQHSGGMPGVSTQFLVFPELNAAIAMLTNTGDRGAGNRTLERILDVVLGEATPGAGGLGWRYGPTPPGKDTHRGLIVHPDGPLQVRFGADWLGNPSLAIGDQPPMRCKAVARGSRLEIESRRDFPLGHPGVGAADLAFELDLKGDRSSGLLYATVDGVCRLPFWCELVREAPKPKDTLRVISYNVLVGFRDSDVGRFLPGCQREAKIAAWLAAQRPDVVALQEMNGFTEDSLRRLAAVWGHPHVAMLKQDGYPVALTSSQPITVIDRHREGLHHGMLHATTHDTDFVVVHFVPSPGVPRKIAECERALQCYRQALAAGRPAIVLGDFNSIAATDVELFSTEAREQYAKWRYLIAGDRPAEIAMTALLEAGAEDVLPRFGYGSPTLPLPRIDFVLASPELAARCTAARWLCDPELLQLSDHPPVTADFLIRANPK